MTHKHLHATTTDSLAWKCLDRVDTVHYFDSIPHDKLMRGLEQRIADRSVLKLIRMWLHAPVVEEDDQGKHINRPTSGTPQGGVISPLLANTFLHWFDRAFYGSKGPGTWAKAKLVRYADDFVVLARFQTRRLVEWIETTLEARMGLVINRKKTSLVNLNDSDKILNFLGYTFRYHRDLKGLGHYYLNVFPSEKALARERTKLREMTSPEYCWMPVPELIGRLNRHLKGWANYFSYGFPRKAMREINWFVRDRLVAHLGRRSQRRYRPPKNVSLYKHLENLGLVYL